MILTDFVAGFAVGLVGGFAVVFAGRLHWAALAVGLPVAARTTKSWTVSHNPRWHFAMVDAVSSTKGSPAVGAGESLGA